MSDVENLLERNAGIAYRGTERTTDRKALMLTSIAISLKRLADAAERIAQVKDVRVKDCGGAATAQRGPYG